MINDRFYEILNASPSDSDEQITEKYQALKAKYSEDRFLEGEAGNIAAKKLTELETAYQEIMAGRRQEFTEDKKGDDFTTIDAAIKAGNLQLAQNKLDEFDERSAEWHYYQSVVYYKKNWVNESKKQLEIACNMEPNNAKYSEAYNKLTSQINQGGGSNQNWNKSGNYAGGYDTKNAPEDDVPQMGNSGCIEWCCEMALCNIMLNLCCSCR